MERNTDTVFKSLLIDENSIKKDIERKAQRVFMLDHQGRIVFKIPERDINNKQMIGIHLLNHYIAHELEIFDTPNMSVDQLATSTNLDVKIVRARVADLKKQNVVESPERGIYRITLVGANKLLDEIINSMKGD